MLNFTGLHIRGNALIKLAQLTTKDDKQKAQAAYNKLKSLSENLGCDLLLELDNKEGIIVSKLSPPTKDTVEIIHNSDFIQGMEKAIKTLEDEEINSQKHFLATDINKYRIIAQIKNINI